MPPVAAPRIRANVQRLVCNPTIVNQIRGHLTLQGCMNVPLALDKIKRDFVKAVRPLVGSPPTVAPQTWGEHVVTQQIVWDAIEVFRQQRGRWSGAELNVGWMGDGIIDICQTLGLDPVAMADPLKRMVERFTGKLQQRQRVAYQRKKDLVTRVTRVAHVVVAHVEPLHQNLACHDVEVCGKRLRISG